MPDGHDTTRTFTADDVARLAANAEEIKQFERFVLSRFADYTITVHGVTDTMGRPVERVDEGTFPRTSSGFGIWQIVPRYGLFPDGDHYTIEHYLHDDRGPSQVTATVHLPKSFVFGDHERTARYQEYLALKAEFEPSN